MEINIINGEKTIVELIGRLDTAATPEAKAALYDIIHAKNDVVMDCKELEYISSSGLRILLEAQKSLKAAGGKLKLINLQEAVQNVLDMTGFSLILDLNA